MTNTRSVISIFFPDKVNVAGFSHLDHISIELKIIDRRVNTLRNKDQISNYSLKKETHSVNGGSITFAINRQDVNCHLSQIPVGILLSAIIYGIFFSVHLNIIMDIDHERD